MYVEGLFLQRTTDARDRAALGRAVGYLQTSRTKEAYPLFDDAGTVVGREEARALLLERQGDIALAHRHILSPDPGRGLAAADLPPLIRDLYARWAMDRGWGPLAYVAAIHTNTGTPHGHLWLAGRTRRDRLLELRPDDYTALHQIAREVEDAASRRGAERRRALRGL